jgi:hypothetical protein
MLNKIADRQLTNKAYRWDSYSAGAAYDPRIQTEDIGNDAIAATALGMKNIERIMANVVEAASYEEGMTYDEVKVAYSALASQFARELGHVTKYIGSATYNNELAQGHSNTEVYSAYPIAKQREAMKFIAENAFKLPAFWKNEDVLQRVGYDFYINTVSRFGTRSLNRLLSPAVADRLVKFDAAGLEVYSPVALYNDIREAVFEEVGDRKPNVGAYRRNLQSFMVNLLIKGVEAPSGREKDAVSEEYRSLARATLVKLEKDLGNKAGSKNSNSITGIHFQNLAGKIAEALDTD